MTIDLAAAADFMAAHARVLDRRRFAVCPDWPARELFSPNVIVADLERLAELQQDHGGWTVDFEQISPAGSLECRGYATVRALGILRRNALA